MGNLGKTFSSDVFGALCDALGAENKNRVKAEYAQKHFFCQLLAEVSCAMQEAQDDFDEMVKRVTRSLVDYTAAKQEIKIPALVSDAVSQVAVQEIQRLVQNMPAARSFSDVHRAIRILAIMTCPAPEKHEVVIRCCVKPLGEPIIGEVARENLKTAMPKWMN